jgi:hypothetical protein
MTRSTHRRRLPGTLLLSLARFVFDESALSVVIRPTIADLQRELSEAGSSRGRRIAARWRGYRAFWILVLMAPFAFGQSPVPDGRSAAFPDVAGRVAASLIAVTLLVVAGPALGAWVVAAAIGGTAFAVIIHRWQIRDPALLSAPDDPGSRRLQINLTATPVGGNIGGLMFVVGSIGVLMLGLPILRWVLLVAVVGGALLAWWLAAWHTTHPAPPVSRRLLALR